MGKTQADLDREIEQSLKKGERARRSLGLGKPPEPSPDIPKLSTTASAAPASEAKKPQARRKTRRVRETASLPFHMRVSPTWHERVARYAGPRGLNYSEFVRVAVMAYIDAMEHGGAFR